MKTNNAIIIFILLSILVISMGSCRRNTSYGIGKVKTKIKCSGGSCDTTLYIYDNQNRISVVSNTNSGTQQYSYNGNTINISNYQGVGPAVCTLGTTGLVSSLNLQTGIGVITYSYSYDNNKYLTSSSGGAPPVYNNYVINNGNTIINYFNEPITYSMGAWDTTYYTYLSDTDKRDYGMAFLGKSSVNLINTDTSYSSSYNYGGVSYSIGTDMHTYTYDNMHRVITETVAGTIYSFTYY